MNEEQVVVGGGVTFSTALTLLFITLKLLDKTVIATWSWWWILSPIWIPTALMLALLIIILAVAFLKNW